MSLLSKTPIYYEHHEDYPEVQKMIRRAKSATRKRKQALEAKLSERKLFSTKQLQPKGTRRDNRDKSPAKKSKD